MCNNPTFYKWWYELAISLFEKEYNSFIFGEKVHFNVDEIFNQTIILIPMMMIHQS